jgi:CubicO group peptidase (beta-lactamase class C family)
MSVGDLALFGAAHLKGLRGQDGLLKATTVQHLHQGTPEQPGAQRLYACGWGIEDFPGIETMHTHNGSNGTFRSQLSIFPKANLVVASFVNRGGESEPSPPLQAVLAVARRYAPKQP